MVLKKNKDLKLIKIYRKYIADESATGVTTDIENIKEEYNKTVKNIESKKLEVSRLNV